jgi:MinD-like ATPase involved in chromosome partitioning or flagellar assembly
MIVVLVVASGAPWESTALTALNGHPGVVVLKRCVDVDDLLASASAGQADVAVLGLDSPGLDVAAVDHLRRHGVRPVAVVAAGMVEPGRVHGSRIGIRAVVSDDDLDALPQAVASPDPTPAATRPPADPSAVPVPAPGATGRVIVVWGPAGAPGRTTLSAAIAGELARRQRRTILVDADPYGGTVAQQLGVLDEVSGLLSAARLATGGALEAGFTSVQRGVDGWLSVVTGLPRPDRYAEVRSGTVEQLLEVARSQADVVVDTGFSLEDEPDQEYAARPGRNQLTLGAISVADELVVVGSADPMGLSRLARALVDVRELTGGAPSRVVVNRMRPTLGWPEEDIAGMVSGFARTSRLHFLPEDRAAVDRALMSGRMLLETGESALTRGVGGIVDALPLDERG